MKKNPFLLNLLLACTVGVYCLVVAIYRLAAPQVVIPKLDLPVMVGLSLIALVIEAYLRKEIKRNWIVTVCLGILTFLLLPLCAGVVDMSGVWKVGLGGGAAFAVAALCYTGITERMRSGGKAVLAPIGNALMLFLAAQALAGLL